MADEGEILTLNAAGNSWVDLIPAGVAEGYQAQNVNIEAHINGWDISSLKWDSGTSKLVLEISGVIDDNGLPIVVKTALSLTISAAGRWYIKMSAGSDFSHRSFSLVSTPGTFDASKMAYYQAGERILNWMVYWDGTNAPYIKKRNPCAEPSPMETMIMPWENVDNIIQDDSDTAIILPAGITYWNFGSPNFANSAGVVPTVRYNIEFKQNTYSGSKWADRGCIYFNGGFISYAYTIGNEMSIYFRLYPKFTYNTAANVFILDARAFVGADHSFYLYYDQSVDKFIFIVRRTTGQLYTITTDAYINDSALQIRHDIFLRVSKANDDADFYVNNVRQGGGVSGSKTKTGSISTINLNRTLLTFGASVNDTDFYYAGYSASLFDLQDVLIENVYSTAYLANYDGSANTKPYYSPTWISGNKQNWQIDANGNAGFRGLSCETLAVNSVDTGAGQIKTKIIPIGAWNMYTAGGGTAALYLNIAHGLSGSKIRNVFVVVFSDAGTPSILTSTQAAYTMVAGFFAGAAGTADLTANIPLFTGGGATYYNTVNYSSVTVNRGYVYIQYLS